MQQTYFNDFCVNATDARKQWSSVIDTAVRKRPVFIKRTRDNVTMINSEAFENLLTSYKFHISLIPEDDGTVTASVKEIDIVDNGATKEEAVEKIMTDLREYAVDFYSEFDYWRSAPNRKNHVPFVLKILLSTDDQLKEALICRAGKN